MPETLPPRCSGMNVFLVDPSMFTTPYDLALRAGLAAAGAQVSLFGRVPRFPDEFAPAVGYRSFFYRGSERLPTALRRIKGAMKATEHALDMARFAALCRRERPSVVHFQWTPVPLLDSVLVKSIASVSATVLTVHDTTPFNGNATSRLQLLGVEKCWSRFDHIITHTEIGRRVLIARGFSPQRVSTIPHGLLESEAPRVMMRRTGDQQALRILFFGQIKPYKGLDTLVDAIAMLPQEARRRVRLRVAGQPYMDMAPILARVAAAGLSDVIEFRLERIPDDDVDALFADADVIAMPYHRIDASGVLSKALAHGMAVLASDTGGFSEFLRHGETALLCPIGDAQAFAEAILDIATDPALLSRLAANASRLGEATPSWTEIGVRTMALYHQVIGRSRRTADVIPGRATARG
jgi:glycosyltransferase involved in cell wall biosynthesis